MAPLDNVFTASANCEHFFMISDAEREFTDMQSVRPFFFSSAFRTRMKAIVHDLPIWREEIHIFLFEWFVMNSF